MDTLQMMRNRLEEKRHNEEFQKIESILQEGFSESLGHLSRKVPFQAASVYCYIPHKEQLHKIADYGGGVNFIERIRFDHGYGISAWVAKKQAPIYLPDIHRGSRHGYRPIRSFLSMPIIIHDELAGVMNFAHIEPNAFERPRLLMIKNYIENVKPIFQLIMRIQKKYPLNRYEKENSTRR